MAVVAGSLNVALHPIWIPASSYKPHVLIRVSMGPRVGIDDGINTKHSGNYVCEMLMTSLSQLASSTNVSNHRNACVLYQKTLPMIMAA